MQSSEIIKRLMKDKSFIGCFPFDQLPALPKKLPAKLIINTGASSTEGEHWVALLLKPKSCFYFDSFGIPIINHEIHKFLQKKYKKVTFSALCIQDFRSNKCGEFCIIFLKNVSNKKTYLSFLKRFNDANLLFNDGLIENFD